MIKPIKDRIVVRKIDETKTASGIILTQSKEETEKGHFVSCGSDCSDNIKNSCVLYFNKYAGTPMEFNGEKYLVMKESEVVAYE